MFPSPHFPVRRHHQSCHPSNKPQPPSEQSVPLHVPNPSNTLFESHTISLAWRSRKLCRCCPHLARLIASGYLDCRDSPHSRAITRIPIHPNCHGITDQVYFPSGQLRAQKLSLHRRKNCSTYFMSPNGFLLTPNFIHLLKQTKAKPLPQDTLLQYIFSCKSNPTSHTHLAIVKPRIHGNVHVHLAVNRHL